MPSIYDFPEELLEHVIALCVAASPIPSPATSPSWHTRTFLTRRTSPLLVSKAFNRIGNPLMYHTINITNPTQAELLLRTLRENPSISPLIRSLVISSITIHSAQALSLCRNLVLLDFALDSGSQPPLLPTPGPREPAPEPDVVEFSKALSNITQLRHLVVRKSSAGVYLTTPRVKHMLCYLAEALPHWDELVSNRDIARVFTPNHALFQETTNFSFRFADDTPFRRPSDTAAEDTPVRLGPIARLTHALATRPKLHSFAAHLPSTWSNAILRISTNKRLERIVLGDGRSDICIIPEITDTAFSAPATEQHQHQQHALLGSGLFFMEARKHAKLIELIKAGTYVDRIPFLFSRIKSLLHIDPSFGPGHAPWKALHCKTCLYASDPYRLSLPGAQGHQLLLLLPHRHRHHLLSLRQGFQGGEIPPLLH